MEGILTQLILYEAFGAPQHDLDCLPPISFVAMERHIGNMFISFIPCHVKIIKNKNDILWKEFWLSLFCIEPLELLNLALLLHLLPLSLQWQGIFERCLYVLYYDWVFGFWLTILARLCRMVWPDMHDDVVIYRWPPVGIGNTALNDGNRERKSG